MNVQPSTTIQWTMKLADASLISDTLSQAADQLESHANYLESERYAKSQRDQYMAAPPAEGEPQRRRSQWSLSQRDQDMIVEYRAKAYCLRALVLS